MTKPDEKTPQPKADPLIDEVREMRRWAVEQHGGDVRRLGEFLERFQRQFADRLQQPPERPGENASGAA